MFDILLFKIDIGIFTGADTSHWSDIYLVL